MLTYALFAIIFGWIMFLTWIVFSTRSHYFRLISQTRKERIDEVMDKLLETDGHLKKEVETVRHHLKEVIDSSRFHIQKVGMVRFHPFEKRSGEQSVVLALLDQEKNGVIINFMYTPEGLRVYTKKVKGGRGEEYSLSDEEVKAITSA